MNEPGYITPDMVKEQSELGLEALINKLDWQGHEDSCITGTAMIPLHKDTVKAIKLYLRDLRVIRNALKSCNIESAIAREDARSISHTIQPMTERVL